MCMQPLACVTGCRGEAKGPSMCCFWSFARSKMLQVLVGTSSQVTLLCVRQAVHILVSEPAGRPAGCSHGYCLASCEMVSVLPLEGVIVAWSCGKHLLVVLPGWLHSLWCHGHRMAADPAVTSLSADGRLCRH
jgi:hypothetical protein